MGEVVKWVADNPDRAEVERREKAAWKACEPHQRLAWIVIEKEEELAALKARRDVADARQTAAWARVYELFGGSWERYLRWDGRRGGFDA
jgi:hypothetical protein